MKDILKANNSAIDIFDILNIIIIPCKKIFEQENIYKLVNEIITEINAFSIVTPNLPFLEFITLFIIRYTINHVYF